MGEFIVGTSGYSYADWVGGFYPAGTRPKDMFAYYARQFRAVELNFTFYRMPAAKTLAAMAGAAPDGFTFWVKANRRTTHEADRTAAAEFIEALGPLIDAGKFAGVLAQFPQRFHRTAANRKLLAGLAEDFAKVPLAVESPRPPRAIPRTSASIRATPPGGTPA
ncbi:MAG: DUF72 domain-containing protein [Planctomycetota bacterium]|nr:DUF72 domain-containing protein [Planctomycetota bacterium]